MPKKAVKKLTGSLQVDYGKLLTILFTLMFLTILSLTEHISDEVLVPAIYLIVGYTFGNGALAVRGKPNQPLITRRPGEGNLVEEPEELVREGAE